MDLNLLMAVCFGHLYQWVDADSPPEFLIANLGVLLWYLHALCFNKKDKGTGRGKLRLTYSLYCQSGMLDVGADSQRFAQPSSICYFR